MKIRKYIKLWFGSSAAVYLFDIIYYVKTQ